MTVQQKASKKGASKNTADDAIEKMREEIESLHKTVDVLTKAAGVKESNIQAENGDSSQDASKSSMNVPTVEKDAPLKMDEVEEREENEPQEKSNKRLFLLGGVILALVILGVLGLAFLYIQNAPEENSEVVPVTQETIQVSPSAALPVLVRSEWTFEVLNGSGVEGVAQKTADKLETLGYKVISIDNADRQTYEGNGLFVSKKMEDKADLIVKDLRDSITIATIAGILKDSTASARIIVGK